MTRLRIWPQIGGAWVTSTFERSVMEDRERIAQHGLKHNCHAIQAHWRYSGQSQQTVDHSEDFDVY